VLIQVGRSLPRLQTGQSEPIMTLSDPKHSRVSLIHGLSEVIGESCGSPAMMPEILHTTLGNSAMRFMDFCQFAKCSFVRVGLPQWSRTNWLSGHATIKS